MRDGAFLGVLAGFFGLAAAYVRGCSRVLGPDDRIPVRSGDSSGVEDPPG